MTAGFHRVSAIIAADFRIRFRRASTAVIFVLLCIAAYLWIPDPSTGRALLQMNDQRALYNSPALAMATASLCSILLGFIGYYMVSNSIGRDTRTRTGFIIASTTVRNSEYLAGIFLGNAIFLSVVIFGFMLSCMAMQLIRGEGSLNVFSFFWHYSILLPPMVFFVSGVAVLFESIRWLSGRFGDLVYFFVWMFTLAVVAISSEKMGGVNITSYIDTFSFAFMLDQVKAITHSDSLSIGSSSYDQKLPPFVFGGLKVPLVWLLPRITSTIYPVVFVFAALFFFSRFNPVKVKASHGGFRRNLLSRLNSLIRPLTVPLFALSARFSARPGLVNAILNDALLTLQSYPLTVILFFGFLAATLISSRTGFQSQVLPALFVVLAMSLAGLAVRERRQGTMAMIQSVPFLKPNFIWWKLGTAMFIVLIFITAPLIRLAMFDLSAALSFLIGSVFVATCAVGLGIASSNPKTFMVLFLLFLYVVLNDNGHTPGFDFAGWYGVATPFVQVIYMALSAGMTALAWLSFRYQNEKF